MGTGTPGFYKMYGPSEGALYADMFSGMQSVVIKDRQQWIKRILLRLHTSKLCCVA